MLPSSLPPPSSQAHVSRSALLPRYSRRAALAAVYTSSELYLLTDFSPGFEDTWAALRRRLRDMAALRLQAQRLRDVDLRAAAASGLQVRPASGSTRVEGQLHACFFTSQLDTYTR